MSSSVQNLEEAATIASEYISTLDNLPSEVQHLLQEIRHKESRSQDIQQEVQKEASKYIRHTLRNVQAQSQSGTPLTSPIPTKEKDAQLPAKIQASYAEIDKLAAEKLELAQRIVELITRARARLDYDLSKVLVLQGETPDAVNGLGISHGSLSGHGSFTLGGRNPVNQINESLRNAFAGATGLGVLGAGDVLPLSPIGQAAPAAVTDAHRNKKRRLGPSTSHTSIKLPSPAPANQYARSRLSQQAHPRNSPARARRAPSSFGPDEDAEGEDDFEENGDEGGDPEDKHLYCFCQKLSYGEMVACDNQECPYQWFHLPCVNMKPPLPEQFFCSECLSKGVNQKKKGRRK
jgi:hypothetical protein